MQPGLMNNLIVKLLLPVQVCEVILHSSKTLLHSSMAFAA